MSTIIDNIEEEEYDNNHNNNLETQDQQIMYSTDSNKSFGGRGLSSGIDNDSLIRERSITNDNQSRTMTKSFCSSKISSNSRLS